MKHIFLLLALAAIMASCNNMNNGNAAKAAKMKQTTLDIYEKVFNAHNTAVMDSFFTADFNEHQIMDSKNPHTLAGVKTDMNELFSAFPDVKAKSNYMLVQGDTLVSHFTMTGTNKGPFMGMPASGKTFTIDGVDIIRFANGKAAEHWGYEDDMGMMMQLHPEMMGMKSDSTKKM